MNLDYEKRYKGALEKAYIAYKDEDKHLKATLERIFPELKRKESEERTRKAILTGLIDCRDAPDLGWSDFGGINIDECIAWLEKQAEQTSPYSGMSFEYNGHIWGMCARDNGVDILLDKQLFKHLEQQDEQTHATLGQPEMTSDQELEPKFRPGDWVIDNFGNTYQIESATEIISEHIFGYTIVGGGYFNDNSNVRLWTIQDAKDGDILVTNFGEDDLIVMYKSRCTIDTINVHCCLSNEFTCSNIGLFNAEDVKPATKEQRELFFQKMKEARWEWDSVNKELIRITKFKVGDWIANGGANPCYVKSIFGSYYKLCSCEGYEYSKHIIDVNYTYHLWTIQDAKDGDVLATSAGAFIYNGNNGGGDCPGSYGGINTLGRFQLGSETHWTSKKVYPATNEQHDTLMKTMANAGYEWDAEKKELKTIEQKPADNVEPKFHPGDWVILNGTVAQILDKQKYGFVGLDIDGKDFFCNYGHTDSMRHWSINDAKDGEVLIASDDSIFLFAGVDDCACKYYFALTTDNYVKINKETKGGYWEASRAVYPATKEQRDLLFQKMADVGYEWDNEKKELKKHVDNVEPKFHKGDWIVCNGLTLYVKEVVNGFYRTISKGGITNSYDWDIDNIARLWTIEDAKDGDVLATSNYIYIFNSVEKLTEIVSFYCLMKKSDEHFSFGDCKIHDEIMDSIPATKEQRHLFFEKMKEDGWEWDNEKKDLKKFKPKFNVGDWIVTEDSFEKIVRHIDAISFNLIDKGYVVSDENGLIYNNISFSKEHKWHKWTIQDAEDGDILVTVKDCLPFIFKGFTDNFHQGHPVAYCGIDEDNMFTPCSGNNWWDDGEIQPATKEQCDLLFKQMKDAGYEWDAEKKELSKQTLKITPKFCIGQLITDNNGTWYKITNIKCLDDWYYEVYDIGEDKTYKTYLELCSIIDERFKYVGEIKK